ncbi:hypothetical protein [Pseudorhodoferax sp.]
MAELPFLENLSSAALQNPGAAGKALCLARAVRRLSTVARRLYYQC